MWTCLHHGKGWPHASTIHQNRRHYWTILAAVAVSSFVVIRLTAASVTAVALP